MPEMNADDHIGKEEATIIPTDGPIEKVKRPRKKAADAADLIHTDANDVNTEAFFNEMLDIVVHETTDPTGIPIPQVNVNGRNQFFLRGQKQKVRRVFVARLARMKQRRYTQSIQMDPSSGNVIQKMIPHVGLRFPFSVIHDPNPNGPAWLQQILSEQ
jgi:hypothetical protein